MPIPGIAQPEILSVDDALRLRKFDGEFDFAFAWYQDPEMVWMVDGVRTPYTMEKLERMYRYLDQKGELYWIETLENGRFIPIGDVTFWQEDMPIVIGEPAYRGKGVGRRIVRALAQRGKALGYDKVYVDSIYPYNKASQHCFEAGGFKPCKQTETGISYVLEL